MAALPGDSTPFDCVSRLREQVQMFGACSLEGVSIVYDRFVPVMWLAVERGFVSVANAEFVAAGLWNGFSCGLDINLLRGRRRFRNYKSAEEARAKVSKATRVRVLKQKTLMLCEVSRDYCVASLAPLIPFTDWRIFPMAAVPKALEPDEVRPVSDHTKTGLKAATVDPRLSHTLDAVQQIEREFNGSVMPQALHLGDRLMWRSEPPTGRLGVRGCDACTPGSYQVGSTIGTFLRLRVVLWACIDAA